jgi:hypothetical protein
VQKKSKYHDDHLRILDAWFAQLLDEIRILVSDALPTPPPSATPAAGMASPTYHVRRYHTENVTRERAVQLGTCI